MEPIRGGKCNRVVNLCGHGTRKIGISNFPDRESMDNLKNLRKDRNLETIERWIIFRFQFRFEVENSVVLTRVIAQIFACKTQGKIVNTRKSKEKQRFVAMKADWSKTYTSSKAKSCCSCGLWSDVK